MKRLATAMMLLAIVWGAGAEEEPTVFEVSKVGKDKSTLLKIFHLVYPPKPLPEIKLAGEKPDRYPPNTVHSAWYITNKVSPKKYVATTYVGQYPDGERLDAILHLRNEPEGGYGFGEEIIAPMVKTSKTGEYLITYRIYEEPVENIAAVKAWEEKVERERLSREKRTAAEKEAAEKEKKENAAFLERLKAGEEFDVTLLGDGGKTIDYKVKW